MDSEIKQMCQQKITTVMLDGPVERLDALHDHLKSIYGRIITSDAAKRVALND
jgi:hypothetical protein